MNRRLIAAFLAGIMLAVICFFAFSVMQHIRQRADWTNAGWHGAARDRLAVARFIVDSRMLDGSSESAVVARLGEPESRTEDKELRRRLLSWEIGRFGSSAFGMFPYHFRLCVMFEEDKAVDVRIANLDD